MSKVRIAVDAMSGDHGYSIVVPAAVEAVNQHSNLHLILVGDREILEKQLRKRHALENERLTIYHASQVVEMDEKPTQALRYKKDSSMRVAINLVKSGDADACVSAGNTGALMATAHFVLKTLPGITRSAIIGLMPSQSDMGAVRLLDLGANVDATPEILFQFAVMGSVLVAAVNDIESPRVGLLNVGVEAMKGNEIVQGAAKLLSESKNINYIGFVEGDDIFKGVAEVIVSDGFVGNVALKTMEGIAKFMAQTIKDSFRKNFLTKLAAVCAMFVLKPVMKKMDPALFNGASFLGLRGIVIKSHGNTTPKGFQVAIEHAMDEVEHNVPKLIEHEVSRLLKK